MELGIFYELNDVKNVWGKVLNDSSISKEETDSESIVDYEEISKVLGYDFNRVAYFS